MTEAARRLKKGVLTVRQLLEDGTLEIPEYQRPYKWTAKNINELFSDIALHKDKTAYRLGTVVFHQDGEKRNIVDGQQRTLSLLLAVRALINERTGPAARNPIRHKGIQDALAGLEERMIDPKFTSSISQANLRNNYLAVNRIVSRPEFSESTIDFLLNHCQFVFFELNEISEAFQFFDSQNARGRDLEPHDLLKAFHLREFDDIDEHLKAEVVSHWENSETDDLARLFSRYLFRIRNWSRGASARYFAKEHTNLFKGVNINRIDRYPYVEQLRIAHHFVDEYNGHHQRHIDGNRLPFPFHLDQIVINGRRFFEMVAHYEERISRFRREFQDHGDGQQSASPIYDGYAPRIFEVLESYEGRGRTGDRYVRSMFDCLLIYYIDKFGYVELSRAVEKAFVWAYHLRLSKQVVQLASMDNHVLENNLFLRIKEATQPGEFLSAELPILQEVKAKKVSKVSLVKDLFRELRYL